MSYAERQDWILYVQENGPLNPMIRMEGAIARALLPFLKKGTKLTDIMIWPIPPAVEGTPQTVMQLLANIFRAGGKGGKKLKYKVRKSHG